MRLSDWLGVTLRYGGFGRHPLLRGAPSAAVARMIASHVAYSREHGFCYFRIPKAANSTVMRTLAHHCGDPAEEDPGGNRAKARYRKLPTPRDLESVYTFTVVRDPFTRIVSAYLNKIQMPNLVAKYRLRPRGHPERVYTFNEFLERLEEDLLLANAHWVPQHLLLPLPPGKLDHVGRVETLQSDLARVVRAVFDEEVVVHTRETGRTRAREAAPDLLDDRARERILRLYARDFELFYPELLAAANAPLPRSPEPSRRG